jgi:hypothetical protein
MRRTGFVAIAAIVGSLFVPWFAGSAQSADLTKIYVWNHDDSDGFNNSAESFIWRQLFLMGDTYGTPGIIKANGDIVDPNDANNKLGTVIKNGGQIIGLKNIDGSEEAYDLKSGYTAKEAWERLPAGGTLVIMTHGAYRELEGGTKQFGGALQLDNAKLYDGFKDAQDGEGTKAKFGNGAYFIGARAGDNMKFELNNCWSKKDPDGAGPMLAVTTSATNVGGVASAKGQEDVINVKLDYDLIGGDAAAQQAANKKIREAAKKAKFVDKDGNPLWEHWMISFPLTERDTKVRAAIDNAAIRLKYLYTLKTNPSLITGIGIQASTLQDHEVRYTVPIQIVPLSSGTAEYDAYNDTTDAMATMIVGVGDLPDSTMFHIKQLVEVPGSPPRPYLSTGVFDFRYQGVEPSITGAIDYRLRVPLRGNPDDAHVYFYDGGSWVPVSSFVAGNELQFSSTRVGIFAAFQDSPVPEVPGAGPWTIALLTAMLAGVGAVGRVRLRPRA